MSLLRRKRDCILTQGNVQGGKGTCRYGNESKSATLRIT